MAPTVFIDGESGTTGLRIRRLLQRRKDLTLLSLPETQRRDLDARRSMLNAADAVVLCLPDDDARAATAMIVNPVVRVLDASTAHRISPGWVYGFPEMEQGQRARIASAGRVTNPGCYPTGFIALARPLVKAGLVPPNWPFTIHAVSGYSGGGKAMIAEFEDPSGQSYTTTAYRPYALDFAHKHLPEMQLYAGLTERPIFAPAVGRFHSGMIVEAPLWLKHLPSKASVADVHAVLSRAYLDEPFVKVIPLADARKASTLDPEVMNGGNGMRLYVFGSPDGQQARVVAVLDNLGKGAAGAAVQNLNLMLNFPEQTGLDHKSLTGSL